MKTKSQRMTKHLLENFGEKFSVELEIYLKSGAPKEIFKWFLASVLFGAPISERSVKKTYECFKKHGVLTPEKIVSTGWDGLVSILDEGAYTRYDFKTSDKLLDVMGNLLKNYDGSLNLLHKRASDPADLEKRLKGLGKGIGDITVNIFLRELRGIWEKADPKPTPLVLLAAKNLGVVKTRGATAALEELRGFWEKNKVPGRDFVNFETALLRLGKDFCRKEKCRGCLSRGYCVR